MLLSTEGAKPLLWLTSPWQNFEHTASELWRWRSEGIPLVSAMKS